MADTVINRTFFSGSHGQTIYHNVSDGTGVSDAVVVDVSTFTTPVPRNLTATSITVERIQGFINGNFILILEFDATTDDLLLRVENHADDAKYFDFDYRGHPGGRAVDPKSTGTAGDLLITTSGLALGDEIYLLIDWKANF